MNNCKKCQLYDELIQDLRNKYGWVYSYFQMLEMDETKLKENPKLQELKQEIEKGVLFHNDRFVKLLKYDI
jgi:hypothetical protein